MGVGLPFKSNILLSLLFNKTIIDKAVLCLQNGCVIKVKMCVCTHVVNAAPLVMWKLKVTLWGSALSFYHVGPRDHTQQVPLDDKCRHLLSHPSSPPLPSLSPLHSQLTLHLDINPPSPAMRLRNPGAVESRPPACYTVALPQSYILHLCSFEARSHVAQAGLELRSSCL